METLDIDMSNTETLQLIDIWEQHPCLWDPNCRDYKNKRIRMQTMEEIGKTFNWSGGKEISFKPMKKSLSLSLSLFLSLSLSFSLSLCVSQSLCV